MKQTDGAGWVRKQKGTTTENSNKWRILGGSQGAINNTIWCDGGGIIESSHRTLNVEHEALRHSHFHSPLNNPQPTLIVYCIFHSLKASVKRSEKSLTFYALRKLALGNVSWKDFFLFYIFLAAILPTVVESLCRSHLPETRNIASATIKIFMGCSENSFLRNVFFLFHSFTASGETVEKSKSSERLSTYYMVSSYVVKSVNSLAELLVAADTYSQLLRCRLSTKIKFKIRKKNVCAYEKEQPSEL